jgi:hypothetical protein
MRNHWPGDPCAFAGGCEELGGGGGTAPARSTMRGMHTGAVLELGPQFMISAQFELKARYEIVPPPTTLIAQNWLSGLAVKRSFRTKFRKTRA